MRYRARPWGESGRHAGFSRPAHRALIPGRDKGCVRGTRSASTHFLCPHELEESGRSDLDAERDCGWVHLIIRVVGDVGHLHFAEATGTSPAQVVLRWHIQRGDIVFPKSVTLQRIKDNFALFDFEIDADDFDAISALDRGADGRIGPNPDTFDYVPG